MFILYWNEKIPAKPGSSYPYQRAVAAKEKANFTIALSQDIAEQRAEEILRSNANVDSVTIARADKVAERQAPPIIIRAAE